MYDTGTVVCGHVVAGYHAECLCFHLDVAVLAVLTLEDALRMSLGTRLHKVRRIVVDLHTGLHPGHELGVLHVHEVGTLVAAHDFIRYHLVTVFVFVQVLTGSFGIQVRIQARLGHHDGDFLVGVSVISAYTHIVDVRTDAKGGVGGQGPGCSGPRRKECGAPPCHLRLGFKQSEEGCYGRILHVAVTSGLIQLVRTQSGTCCGGVRLYSITFIEQSFVVQLLQQPPKGLDITVFVGNIRMVEVDPVTHLL